MATADRIAAAAQTDRSYSPGGANVHSCLISIYLYLSKNVAKMFGVTSSEDFLVRCGRPS